MNADLRRIIDNCRVHLPGALDAGIQLALFSTLQDFFDGSNCWTEDIEFSAVPDQLEYVVVPAGTTTITRLAGVWNSDDQYISASMRTPGDIRLAFSPSQADTYTARVILNVTDPTTRDGYPEFPDWVAKKYGVGLTDGVLGYMMAQPAKPYSNERLGIFHMRRFRSTVARAKVEASHENVYRGQNWKFPQTFASRNWR